LLAEAAALALDTGELRRMAPVAVALGEAAWLKNDGTVVHPMLLSTYELAIRQARPRAVGELGYWCHQLGLPTDFQCAVEQPYALQSTGRWQAASAAWQELGCPYERAHALMRGDESGMLEALGLFEKLGATAAAKRCREKLRDAGVRGVARGPRASTSNNIARLTSRELQIVALLAEGLTNAAIAARLVRSEKTIDHHISAIFRKLEVRSRSAAVTAAERLGLFRSG
jgi:DNA-binding CsgD family transcriptional regulator